MVTLVGQEILRGKHISVGGVTPRDWLYFIISLLCHDIGYVRGICQGDENGRYVSNLAGDKVAVPEGATDASLTPSHVVRSKLFIRRRFGKSIIDLDIPQIERNIEHTRFPVPEDELHQSTADYPGLLRAADLIGQLADINYLRKQPALFNEFRETGTSEKLGYKSVADLRDNYPDFFWQKVRPASEMHCATCGSPREANNFGRYRGLCYRDQTSGISMEKSACNVDQFRPSLSREGGRDQESTFGPQGRRGILLNR